MLKRLILAPLAVAILAPVLGAQTRIGFGRPTHGGPGLARGITFNARNHSLGGRGFYLGDTPYFYADYPFQQFAAEPALPRGIVRESRADTPQEKSEPLLIEWRGDRYVRFGGAKKGGQTEVATPPDYAEGPSTKLASRAGAAPAIADLPPAMLIYRDGHHEQVSDYAIIGAVMYARGDYWRNGYWTKNIQLSALNLPATMKANQDSGVKFSLPAGPNEVVTRP